LPAGETRMNINESNEVYGRITRVINELKMARQSVTIFKVSEMTGIDPFIVFQYFYEKGLLRGK
jgi:predicted transcriptional regulator